MNCDIKDVGCCRMIGCRVRMRRARLVSNAFLYTTHMAYRNVYWTSLTVTMPLESALVTVLSSTLRHFNYNCEEKIIKLIFFMLSGPWLRRFLLKGSTAAGLSDEVFLIVVRSPDFFDSFVFQFRKRFLWISISSCMNNFLAAL